MVCPVSGLLDAVALPDATGITVLLGGLQAAGRRGIGYRIVNPHGIVYRVLNLTDTLILLTKPAST